MYLHMIYLLQLRPEIEILLRCLKALKGIDNIIIYDNVCSRTENMLNK